MSQVTGSITLNDGAATPVARTFAVAGVTPSFSEFQERSAGASAGFWKLNVAYSPANAGRKTNKVDYKIDMPILETIGGITQVTRRGLVEIKATIPDTFTVLERAHLMAFAVNALSNTQLRAVAKDLDPLY